MIAHDLQRELAELTARHHAGKLDNEKFIEILLAVCDGFTDSKMDISDVVKYATTYIKALPYPQAAQLAAYITSKLPAAPDC